MKIINEWPPNIDEIRNRFDISGRNIYFSYGGNIYNPSGMTIARDYIEHEKIHATQHEVCGGSELWWERYLRDDDFMIQQEVEAWGGQLKFIRETQGSAKAQNFLTHACEALSSRVYGKCISRGAAKRKIMNASV